MKHLFSFLLPVAILFFTASCNKSEVDKRIFGNWAGVEWLVEGQPSTHTPGDAIFTFDSLGVYTFTYQDNIEKGTYYINGNQLFTTPDGGIKMMVKIPKLTVDTLVFYMNRGGQAETLTLVRK